MTVSRAREMGKIIKPLLDQGQSPYVIVKNHPELGICEKTTIRKDRRFFYINVKVNNNVNVIYSTQNLQ